MLLCLGSMIDSNARIVEITSKDAFERELAQAQVTVVVFWADWCGSCRLLMPISENDIKTIIQSLL